MEDKQLLPKIKEMLKLAQHSSANHVKSSLAMKSLCDKDEVAFINGLTHCMKIIFSSDYTKKESAICHNRVIDFLSILYTRFQPYCADETFIEHRVFMKLFEFLLQCTKLKDVNVRYWSCKLICKVFDRLEEVSECVHDKMRDTLLQVLEDPKVAVRIEAIVTLHRFQEPKNKNDPIILAFVRFMNSDYFASIREMCVEKIALTLSVLPHLINRARDVNVNVRMAAFKRLAPIVGYLQISQRREILVCGFLDSSEKITKYVNCDLLQSWLENFENDIVKLLESVRFDDTEEDVTQTVFLWEKMLEALLKKSTIETMMKCLPLNEKKCLDFNSTKWETAFYHQVLVDCLQQNFEEALESVLPQLVEFCDYIKGFCTFAIEMKLPQFQCILKELFTLCQRLDVSDDVVGCERLTSLILYILREIALEPETGRVLVSCLKQTTPNVAQTCIDVCEVVSEILYSENGEKEQKASDIMDQIKNLRRELSTLQNQELDASLEHNFEEAAKFKQLHDEKTGIVSNLQQAYETLSTAPPEKTENPDLILRSLGVVTALFLGSPLKKLPPCLETVKNELIKPALIHSNMRIRLAAFQCFALYGYIDIQSANIGMQLFSIPIFAYNADQNVDHELLIICIDAVVDLIQLHGAIIAAPDRSDIPDTPCTQELEERIFTGGECLTELIQQLVKLLNDEELKVQETAVAGISRLLVNNAIHSAPLISILIVKWANPATDGTKIRQLISLALQTLSEIQNCTSYLQEAVLLTIKTILHAPNGSPLQDINIDDLMKFMLCLCEASPEGEKIHTNLAEEICREMLKNEGELINVRLSKILLLLRFPITEDTRDLFTPLCDEIKDSVGNTAVTKNVTKFLAKFH